MAELPEVKHWPGFLRAKLSVPTDEELREVADRQRVLRQVAEHRRQRKEWERARNLAWQKGLNLEVLFKAALRKNRSTARVSPTKVLVVV